VAWASLEDALSVGYGIERAFRCHVHDDSSASASVNSVTGAWFCYACGAKGRFDTDKVDIPSDTLIRETEKVWALLSGEHRSTFPESWLTVFTAAGPGEYWSSRYNAETCAHFKLGYDETSPMYPFRDSTGRVLGIVRRQLDKMPKYLYPPGVKVSQHLFNFGACSGDEIILTEGATDAIACWEVGYEAMAIYGSRLSRDQQRLVHRYAPKKVWLGFDNDTAGEQACADVESALGVPCERLVFPTKDLSEMERGDRQRSLAQNRVSRVGSSTCGSFVAPRQLRLPRRPSSST